MSNGSASSTASPAPAWAQLLRRYNQYMMFDMGGGPRPLKLAWVINLQKAGSFPFMAFLMWYYADQTPAATSTAAWVYLALHGSYGLNWLIKDLLYPDPNWQGRATIPSSLFGVFGLGMYWLAGWIVISGYAVPDYPLPETAWLALCISLCVLGCVIMTAADVQKFTALKLRRGLITDGMFTYIRHPNYLGEMMIYGALAMIAWHWIPALVLAYYWLTMFSTNMVMKEASMSRYPEWAAYKKRSWWLVPGVL
jgi:protein-S-isoprenylcysteine O-methyltransferase Ste14